MFTNPSHPDTRLARSGSHRIVSELYPQSFWLRQLRSRLTKFRWFKSLAVPTFAAGFFVAYFQLLNHPLFPVTVLPLTAVDNFIGFYPLALLPYLSLWAYVFLVPALLQDRGEIMAYCTGAIVLAGIGLGVFLVWPTAIPNPNLDWTIHPGFEFLKRTDAAGNACPSLHVAFAVFTAAWLERLFRANSVPSVLRWV